MMLARDLTRTADRFPAIRQRSKQSRRPMACRRSSSTRNVLPEVGLRAARHGGAGVSRPDRCTAVDYLPREPRYEILYLLLSPGVSGYGDVPARLRVKVRVPGDDPRVPTLSGVWGSANWGEREIYDLFGITFDGHPDLRRDPDAGRLGRVSAAARLSGADQGRR